MSSSSVGGVLVVGHEAVVAREVAGHQLGGGGEARCARVEPPEEGLDEAPGHERREQPFGGRMEGAHVERARVTQRRVRGARRERLVHVDEVEWHRAQQFLEGPRHVDRWCRNPPARPVRARPRLKIEHLADGEDPRGALIGSVEQGLGI